MKFLPKIYAKYISLFLVLLIILSAVGVATVNSAENESTEYNLITYNKELYENNKEACDRLYEGLCNRQDQIWFSDLKLTKTQMGYLFKTVLRKYPELFYVNHNQYGVGSYGTYADLVVPYYRFDSDQISAKQEEFNRCAQKLIAGLTPDMSEYDRALIIHDRLAIHCKYLDEDGDGHITAYDAIVDGNANCQGYTSSYSYLLSLAGVRSEIVESSEMYHIWNKVCIDGEYYNVDLTWDDPIPDKAGYAKHKYFLLSDEEIMKADSETGTPHYGFDFASYKSDSKKYDNSLLRQRNTRVCIVGGKYYEIDNMGGSENFRSLLEFDPEANTETTVCTFDYKWMSGTGGHWRNSYMSLDENNGILYYNTPDSICFFDPATSDTGIVAQLDTSEGDCYGMEIKDGKIYAYFGADPNTEWTGRYISDCILFSAVINPGDVNEDGTLDISDATEIQKYLCGNLSFDDRQKTAADYNKDRIIDIADTTAIQKSMVGM